MKNNQNENKNSNEIENEDLLKKENLNMEGKSIMNKKMKNKRIAIISGVIAVVAISGFMIFGNINKAQNEFVGISSTVVTLKEFMRERNTLILSAKDELRKYDKATIALEEVEIQNDNLEKLSKVNSKNYFPKNTQEVNENFEVLKGVEKSVEKLIAIYNKDEDMKKNERIANKFEEVMNYSDNINYIVEDYNVEYKEAFNKCINKFPINIMKKKYNIIEMENLNLK